MTYTIDDRKQASLSALDRVGADAMSRLVAARLCHDLASPLGAICNGVELLELTQTQNSPELQLLAESARQATARLRLFRMAFGPVAEGQIIAANEFRDLCAACRAQSRLWIDASIDSDMPRAQAKAIMLALLCLEWAMPYGGQVQVRRDGPGVTLVGQADRFRPEADPWRLVDPAARPDAATASTIQFAALGETAHTHGLSVDVSLQPMVITLRLALVHGKT